MIKTSTPIQLVSYLTSTLEQNSAKRQMRNVEYLKSFENESQSLLSRRQICINLNSQSSNNSHKSRNEDEAECTVSPQPPKRRNISKDKDSKQFKPKKVFVSFNDPNITVSQFRKMFSKFGKLRQAYLCKPKPFSSSSKKNLSRYGFVTFYDLRNAKKLVSLKSIQNEGKQFKVELMKYKPEYRQQKEWKKRQKYRIPEIFENQEKVHHKIDGPSKLEEESEVVVGRGHNKRARFTKNKLQNKKSVGAAGLLKSKDCNSRPNDDEKLPVPKLKNKVRVGGVLDHKMLAKIDGRHSEFYVQKILGPVFPYYNYYRPREMTLRRMYLLPK